MNGTLFTHDGHWALRFERLLRHPPEKVWRAITEPEQLAGWFPARIEGERAAGAPLRFVQEGGSMDGKIIEHEPPRLFGYTWGDAVMRFELRPDPAGTLLIFTHTFDERPSAASFAAGWHQCLDALTGVLVGRPAPIPQAGGSSRAYRVRHEAYAEVFGLLAGSVEGGAVRFERLLPYPAAQVWAALSSPAPVPSGPAPAPSGPAAAVGGHGVAVGGAVPAGATSAAAPSGAVTEAEEPRTLAYAAGSGPVRWELGPGPGGTLVTLTHRVPAAGQTEALAAWHARLERLAFELARSEDAATAEETLRHQYEFSSEGNTSS